VGPLLMARHLAQKGSELCKDAAAAITVSTNPADICADSLSALFRRDSYWARKSSHLVGSTPCEPFILDCERACLGVQVGGFYLMQRAGACFSKTDAAAAHAFFRKAQLGRNGVSPGGIHRSRS